MPAASSQENLTVFPPFEHHRRDSPLELGLGRESPSSDMTSPFIKSEPSDYNNFDPNQYMQFDGHHSNNNMSNPSGNMNVNPANLTNGNNAFMSSSFIADDELLDLHIDQAPAPNGHHFDFGSGMSNFMNQQQMSQQSPGVFSNAGEHGSMASPFSGDFNNYNQFRSGSGQQFGAHSLPQQQQTGFRPHMQHIDRKVSDSRSPATPNTPSMNHLNIDDYTHPGMQAIQHRAHNSLGNGWESTPSGHSWDQSSPYPSPQNGQPVHAQISEVLKNNTHHHKVASSLPTKMEPGTGPNFGNPAQDAKKKRRRESHNMVERRRRDNINERIHDLGTLVPQHRLEDEKVRKHLQTNAPLSPSIANAASMSPPNAAASLLGASSRRTGSGNITQGIPMEDKDKGPNKGDILNGSVAWTRDMMWFMHMKLHQEQEVKELVSRLGGTWPFEVTDEEKRMRSEILEVLNKHTTEAGFSGFTGYSRAPGSGLRVPGFTNVAGDSTNDGQSLNGVSLPPISPGFQPGGSGMSSGMSHHAPNQFWATDLKEEEDYELMQ
ncbi:related to HLH transcription factor (GlcD gamma) [Ramularia collo-cygni]|uniref:Related to HLH transcription factor (GlcD gamma) n=1 Tax=Ramularia collo-cygni TaxID=112498 RepID=A0A2D3UZP8_9PEZI|nr:related to HLH transcription factor (GlcD gamma) [Ramularia collo-cygni]CZT16736.1 related to HLH transcription factor (GlcD gamma) [Ramularia collo-cygni]